MYLLENISILHVLIVTKFDNYQTIKKIREMISLLRDNYLVITRKDLDITR